MPQISAAYMSMPQISAANTSMTRVSPFENGRNEKIMSLMHFVSLYSNQAGTIMSARSALKK